MTRTHTVGLSAVAAAAVAIAAGAVTTPAAANAAEVYSLSHSRAAVVYLTHAETVTAAQIGAGNVINAVLGDDHWSVTLESDSRYADRWYYRPDKRRVWNNITGQQLVAEAAAHPGGRVALGYTPSTPGHPLWVEQTW